MGAEYVDLFGDPAPPPAPPRQPGYSGPPKWARTNSSKPCDPCLVEQRKRAQRGEPWGWRGRVVVARRSPAGETLMCERHARDQGWSPASGGKGGTRPQRRRR